jgi:hypothetical protein
VAVSKTTVDCSNQLIYLFKMIRLRQANQTNDINSKIALLDQAAMYI